ncbi:hypothetical protein [Pseudomonas frederiksbergensis]|jgi:hypothetical protein|uniref:hypothetical protein n=1 Tax=Pseudomonas TaxID=286 RepID=UPI0011CDF237|nr:hypothetical protein [Pseudomonas frederiksbergensis]
MRVIWNERVGLRIRAWACVSLVPTYAVIKFILDPLFDLEDVVLGRALVLSVLMNIILFSYFTVGWRDREVAVEIVPEGLDFRDEAAGYCRRVLIHSDEILKIKVTRNIFFDSLVIELKDDQRFSFSNMIAPQNFVECAQSRISY